MLEGGIEGRPENVIFYATSNRRHLLPRDMMENERSTAINPGEAVEEKVSLSDRFGLWLGFHRCSQDEYLDMVFGYADHFGLPCDRDATRAEALEWATTRGSRSGRTAWQFIQDLAGRLGKEARVTSPGRRGYAPTRPGRCGIGSTGVAPFRISKWSCGEVTLPVWPDFAMVCAALHLLAVLHVDLAVVGVGRDIAVVVADQHELAVALHLAAGIGDRAVLGRLHRRSLGHGDVDALVAARAAEAGDDAALGRPAEADRLRGGGGRGGGIGGRLRGDARGLLRLLCRRLCRRFRDLDLGGLLSLGRLQSRLTGWTAPSFCSSGFAACFAGSGFGCALASFGSGLASGVLAPAWRTRSLALPGFSWAFGPCTKRGFASPAWRCGAGAAFARTGAAATPPAL